MVHTCSVVPFSRTIHYNRFLIFDMYRSILFFCEATFLFILYNVQPNIVYKLLLDIIKLPISAQCQKQTLLYFTFFTFSDTYHQQIRAILFFLVVNFCIITLLGFPCPLSLHCLYCVSILNAGYSQYDLFQINFLSPSTYL